MDVSLHLSWPLAKLRVTQSGELRIGDVIFGELRNLRRFNRI